MVRVFSPTGSTFIFSTFRVSALSQARSPARQEESLPRWDCSRPLRNLRVRATSLTTSGGTPIYPNPGDDKPARLGFSGPRFRTEEIGYVRCLIYLILKIRSN